MPIRTEERDAEILWERQENGVDNPKASTEKTEIGYCACTGARDRRRKALHHAILF
jgi:hypothetical protein